MSMDRLLSSPDRIQLANAIVDMAMRLSESDHMCGLAFGHDGIAGGKPRMHWERAASRQLRAIRRLANALGNLP